MVSSTCALRIREANDELEHHKSTLATLVAQRDQALSASEALAARQQAEAQQHEEQQLLLRQSLAAELGQRDAAHDAELRSQREALEAQVQHLLRRTESQDALVRRYQEQSAEDFEEARRQSLP